MLNSLLSNVSNDLVCVHCTSPPKRRDHTLSHQADRFDRPSFSATVNKVQSKYHLSEREQAWLVGDMV